MTETQAAARARMAPATLRSLRAAGKGPLAVRMGRSDWYHPDDLDTWITSREDLEYLASGKQWIGVAQAAAYLGVSSQTLRLWYGQNFGPPHIRLNRMVRYQVQDLDAWLAAQTPVPPDLLSEPEAAAVLGVAAITLHMWRKAGKGPVCLRYGRNDRRVGYRRADLDAFLAARRETETTLAVRRALGR